MTNETKEQRRARKALEKQSLSVVLNNDVEKKYVVCLKWGTKYSAEYVNRLHSMVERNLTLPHEFICFTENTDGINKQIRTEPLPNLPITGWWYKVWFLSNELPIKGTLLFLDLDLIVFRNIDNLFNYKSEKKFCIIRDFNRHVRSTWDRMNSSVFRTQIGYHDAQYQNFKKNAQAVSKNTQGDQDWMFKNIKNFEFWPDEWIQSYKWEMRNKHELGIVNGRRNFKTAGIPRILDNTSIAVFHGEPNIHDCVDNWPRDNWG